MLENSFTKEFLKSLKQKEEDAITYVSSATMPIEEHALHVGYIRAIKEVNAEFERLYKAFFST